MTVVIVTLVIVTVVVLTVIIVIVVTGTVVIVTWVIVIVIVTVVIVIVQGDFFDWSPSVFISTKSLYKLRHLEKFWASLHGIWNSAKFRGDQ